MVRATWLPSSRSGHVLRDDGRLIERQMPKIRVYLVAHLPMRNA